MNNLKTVKLKEDTYNELRNYALWGESLDMVVKKLLTCYKENAEREINGKERKVK
jgi:hypothetical protein